jgi:hypothetical protein
LALSKSYLDELDRGRKIVERAKIQYNCEEVRLVRFGAVVIRCTFTQPRLAPPQAVVLKYSVNAANFFMIAAKVCYGSAKQKINMVFEEA